MKIEPKFVVKVAGTLTAISLVVAALLGVVNGMTKDIIAQFNKEKTEAALSAVVTDAGAEFVPMEITDELSQAAAGQSGKLTELYEVQSGGSSIGYAMKIVAGGSQGDIEMVVGVDTAGAITGISVVDHSETSGIGTKVIGNEATTSGVGALDQFVGLSGAGSLVVKQNIMPVSGATVSTQGITKGANAALAVVEALS